MLGLHRLTGSGVDYYLSDLAQELPLPLQWAEGRAEWAGRAADGLELRGRIDPRQLEAVLDGCHPITGHRLRSERATVRGFDLTFSAPKSVSVVFALGGEEVARRIVMTHRDSVRGALSYIEAHALAARRGSGEEREIVPTSGVIGTSFTHGVNRNLDPHLHSHVLVANMVHGRDGRWSACDHRGLWAHRAAASAVYEAHLRAGLSAQLGVRWAEAPGLRAEIDGISPYLLGEFSSRSADIRRHMAEYGARSARGARVAWAATREPKRSGLDFGQLSAQWRRRARAFDSPDAEMSAVLGHRTVGAAEPFLDEHRFGAVLSQTPDGAARRRDVTTAFSVAARDGAAAETIERLTQLWTPPLSARGEVGVAEGSRTLRSVVPGPHLLTALGPRPVDPTRHEVWREASHVIDSYRQRWGVAKGADALGVEGLSSGISALPTERLVDHLRVARDVEVACQRLGWRAVRTYEMDRGR